MFYTKTHFGAYQRPPDSQFIDKEIKKDKVRSPKKITGLFGNFSQMADTPPPLLGTPNFS